MALTRCMLDELGYMHARASVLRHTYIVVLFKMCSAGVGCRYQVTESLHCENLAFAAVLHCDLAVCAVVKRVLMRIHCTGIDSLTISRVHTADYKARH